MDSQLIPSQESAQEESLDPSKNMPPVYYVGSDGGVYKSIASPLNNHSEQKICSYTLFPTKRFSDEETRQESVELQVKFPQDGVRYIKVPSDYLVDQKKLLSTLALNGVYLHQTEAPFFMTYMLDCIKHIQKREKAQEECARYGWRDLETEEPRFVMGDYAMSHTGELTRIILSQNLFPFKDVFCVKGNLEDWRNAFNVYKDVRNSMPLQFTLMLSFAAPLLAFTPHHGLIYNMIGESGGGKSTSLKIMSSVWGKPNDKHLILRDNSIPLFNTLGALQSIPVTFDELTGISSDRLMDLAYSVTDGRGKHRAHERGHMRTNTTRWQTVICGASNLSLYEKLGMDSYGNNAHAYRIFEVTVPNGSQDDKQKIDSALISLDNNHGLAGRFYIAYIIKNIKEISSILTKNIQSLSSDPSVNTAERFWYGILGCIKTGAEIAKHLELHDYDVDQIINFGFSQIIKARKSVQDMAGDALLMLSHLFQSKLQESIHIYDDKFVDDGKPLNAINIRFEWEKGIAKKAFISLQCIKGFCASNKILISWFSKKLYSKKILKSSSVSINIGRGTPNPTAFSTAWEIDLTHEVFMKGGSIVMPQNTNAKDCKISLH